MPKGHKFKTTLVGVLVMLEAILASVAGIAEAQDANAGFLWQGNGLKLETAPLPQDQVIAFFLARGFDSDTARLIAQEGCIFRSAIGSNDLAAEGGPVLVDLSQWQILAGGQEQGLRTRQHWAQTLSGRQIDPAAAIAFEWALFPTEQNFGPDDYNWGLLSFALPPGTRFDLSFSWAYDGTDFKQKFTGMECAK